MLYHFNTASHQLDPLESISASAASVLEKEIEEALARQPASLFLSSRDGPPVLIVKQSVSYRRMADIIALDAEGRLVLVECKRGLASRDTLAQLLDYASDYDEAPHEKLLADWKTGVGKDGSDLRDRFRKFAEDDEVELEALGKDHVLVVVAAQKDEGFEKIATYLEKRGVSVYFVQVGLYRRSGDELYLDVIPIELDSQGKGTVGAEAERVWFFNTDETYNPGAWKSLLERNVLGVFGYPTGARTLQQGAQAGDLVYAYRNVVGIIAKGTIVSGDIYRAPEGESVFDHCKDGNEWHMKVDWTALSRPIPNAQVRKATGAMLPVRNTFCRLWKPDVRGMLAKQARSTS